MKNTQPSWNTIRLLMPQWQGGNNGKPYPLGARLLAWLAPESTAPLVEVPVERYDGSALAMEDGIVGRAAITRQLRAARNILDAYRPDRVITFGGDCLVSQAPFAYLNERYDGKLGVLWIDAHPDVTTPRDFPHSHAMALGNLLGEGDALLAKEVARPLDPRLVMLAGVDETHSYEDEVLTRLGIRRAPSSDVVRDSGKVLEWIRANGIEHLAIHVDLDVLDSKLFRSLLFNNPDLQEKIDAPEGRMTFPQLTRLINDVAAQTGVAGITYAEHMPWDDINLMHMMEQFSFMK